jgi:two-component system response regulator RegA
MHILIVDDDAVFLRVMARSLERHGMHCVTAEDAAQAIESCMESQPDACLLDLKLGADNGLDLIQQLLELQPALRIVLLTGYASIATAVEAIKRGAYDYLPKPVAAKDVLKVLGSGKVEPAPAEVKAQDAPSLQRLEWEHIQRVLAEQGGNISATARALGMHRRTLQRKLAKRPVQK